MSDILDDLWLSRNPKAVLFKKIIDGYHVKVSDRFPNRFFYMKDDNLLIEYLPLVKKAWINDKLIWSLFLTEFNITNEEMEKIMILFLQKYLNIHQIIPYFNTNYMTVRMEIYLKEFGKLLTEYDGYFRSNMEK